MSSFRLQKKSRRLKQYSLWQLRFCQAQKPWKRKETERTYSLRTHFGALRGRDGEEEEPLASVVFPPSTIAKQCTKRHAAVHRLLIGLYDYQACSVGLKMDVYMHRREESRSQSTVDNRSTEFEVTTSLRRNTVCTSVIVGYGVNMKRRLCVSVQCAGYFFSPKLTKTSSIRDRLLLSSKRSSLSLYRLRDVWALTEKQPVSTSFSSWSGPDWSP